jgi:hypothetical protein
MRESSELGFTLGRPASGIEPRRGNALFANWQQSSASDSIDADLADAAQVGHVIEGIARRLEGYQAVGGAHHSKPMPPLVEHLKRRSLLSGRGASG